MARINYQAIFEEILSPLRIAEATISQAEILSDDRLSGVSEKTARNHLKNFISKNFKYFGVVEGLLPDPETLIDLAEKELSQSVSEKNIVLANRTCANIVNKAIAPMLDGFVKIELKEYIHKDVLEIPIDSLIRFLSSEYASFAKGMGNGLVSIAGSLNEKLLARCLREKGMAEGTDFSVTGTDSDGDLIVHSKAANKQNLGVEIKSYHARERLLRGLRDIERPKVGAGYFIDPSEFNETRTRLLLETQTAAIYMPMETIEKLSAGSRQITATDRIAFGNVFYRPLERFASDMYEYSISGRLPS